MKKVRLEFDPSVFQNLRVLLVAGVKSPQTPDTAIMAGAQILQILDLAAEEFQKSQLPATNGALQEVSP